MEWISTSDLAAASGLTSRHVERLCAAAFGFGQPLDVRRVSGGKGGKSGLQYFVNINCLPVAIRSAITDRDVVPTLLALRIDDKGAAEHNWKAEIIRPILEHAKNSAERKAAFLALDGKTRLDWRGKPKRLALSTLHLWVKTFEENDGMNLCLAQKVRADKGDVRTRISRQWESAVPFEKEIRETIADDITLYLRSLIKGGAQRKQALELCGAKLRMMTSAYGFVVSDAAAKKIFKLPVTFWRAHMDMQKAYIHRVDRKASEDAKPRIRRTIEGLEPMEVVVMDVHHINVRVKRENGTTATPKLLAFHDLATYRTYCEIIFFEGNGGVRNQDIIQAFMNMCQDPSYGVPKFLYADNGAEYGFADHLNDALKLGSKVIGFNGSEDRNRIIRAKPYNAAAKHVEGWFGQMNRQYFRHLKGWIDDDRMNPKRPTLGKLPDPYDAGFDSFVKDVRGLLVAYDNIPQGGALKGKSPAATFQSHVDTGWKATLMSEEQMATVFCKPTRLVVRAHGVKFRNQHFVCDGLLKYQGDRVIAHIPKYGYSFNQFLVTDERGRAIGIAKADQVYGVTDERGAKESARRISIRNKELTRLQRSVPTIDVLQELVEYGARQMAVVPNEPDAIISVRNSDLIPEILPPIKREKNSKKAKLEEARQMDAIRDALLGRTDNGRKVS